VVEQALARGHDVVALARRPEAVSTAAAGRLRVAQADVLDPGSLERGLAGVDAVVSALGRRSSRTPTTLFSEGSAHLLRAMAAHEVQRLVVVSALPVAPPGNLPGWQRTLVLPLLWQLFGGTYDDLRRMESVLAGSEADWTVLRPARLVDRPATGTYRLEVDAAPGRGGSLPFADLATALLDAVLLTDLHRRAAYVAR
jgi:putative NADH-flavin reductase